MKMGEDGENLHLWASTSEEEDVDDDREMEEGKGRKEGIKDVNKVGVVARQTQAKLSQLKTQRRRGNRQGAATTSALSEKGHRTGVKSELGGGRAGVHPEGKDSTHRGPASQAEVKRDRKPGSNRNSSSQPSRTGHRRGVIAKTSNPVAAAGGGGRGVRRGGTPLAEPATTSSLNAEIRGLFERATKAEPWHPRSQVAVDENLAASNENPNSTSEIEVEEEHMLKTQARQLEAGKGKDDDVK